MIRNVKLLVMMVLLLMISSELAVSGLPAEENSQIDYSEFMKLFDQSQMQPDGLPSDLIDTPLSTAYTDDNYNYPATLRDNVNSYTQVWNPWITRAGVHVSAVSEDGDFMAVGGGYLVDTTVHIYRWNLDTQEYDKVWEAGSGIINGDIYDIEWADLDNNGLQDMVVASADGHIYVFEQAHIYDPFTSLDSRFDFVWKSDKMFQVSSVEVADIDLDNIPDLIAGAWDNKVHVFEYTRHSGYPFAAEHWMELEEKWVSDTLDDKVQALDSGDINNNGLPDVVVGTLSGSIYIYENDGIVVPTGTGGTAPFPNDNNYAPLWNSSGRFSPIWNMIGHIEMAELDSTPGSEAVILAWGQGSYVLHYDAIDGFFLEQMIKPFESFQYEGMYPLDNWADFMLSATNVYADASRVASTIPPYDQCTAQTTEPNLEGICYLVNSNSGATDAPDGIYSRFVSNGTYGAEAIWNIGVGEEIATNANDAPDVYLLMKLGHAVPSEWRISVSNDLNRWYYANQSQLSVVSGPSGSALGIDFDPLFALNQLTKARYIKLELIPTTNGYTREIDAMVIPYVARPLTLAVSATIDELYFDYIDRVVNNNKGNRIIFGGTDGRLMVYSYEAIDSITYRNPASIMQYLNFDKSSYNIRLPVYSETWDSYVNDFYNLGETIWSIQSTSKRTFIPSWRYITGWANSPDFSAVDYTGAERIHHLSLQDLTYLSGNEVVVTSNSTGDTHRMMIYDQYYKKMDLAATNYYFGNINSYYATTSASYGSKIITSVFGEFDSDVPGNELITIPWYQNPLTLNYTDKPYDAELFPRLWMGGLQAGSPFGLSSQSFGGDAGVIEDSSKLLYGFLDESDTYPSGYAVDITGDGLTDLVLSNGRLALMKNVGSASYPLFELDTEFFEELNEIVTSQPIFSPQFWDYDRDGDLDIMYSFGIDTTAKQRYGLNFYRNDGTDEDPTWERTTEIVSNPTLAGGMRANEFTYGFVEISSSARTSATALWVYSPVNNHLRKLHGETEYQSSFMIGTNPEVMKLEVNKLVSEPNYINFGYTITESWANTKEFTDWTLSMTTGKLDNDNNNEIIVSDFDNNLYVFEHLTNNTYKRAFKSHNLNHTLDTEKSPYRFQDLEGIDGSFTKIIFDHGNLLATGIDGDQDDNLEFIVTAAQSVYVFEATGFNDEYRLMYETDMSKIEDANGNYFAFDTFSAISVTSDFDGRGPMIALAANNLLFLLRYDPAVGWVESFQGMDGIAGADGILGNPNYDPSIEISTLLFADLNQDSKTELWIGGKNTSTFTDNAFLVAVESEYGNYHQVYAFPQMLTQNNVLNDMEISNDMDRDGKLELVIAHKFGVDIWEIDAAPGFALHRIEIISSDPSYGSNTLQPTFGEQQSPDGLASHRHDMFRLSNGQYVVVYGNETNGYRDYIAPFTGQDQIGVLRYALTDDPSDIGAMGTQNRVSTETFTLDLSVNTFTDPYWSYTHRLWYETEPSITQASDGFYIGWIAYYKVYSGGVPVNGYFATSQRYMLQKFDLSGNKVGTSKSLLGNYPLFSTLLTGPALSVDPFQTSRIMYSFMYYNRAYNFFVYIDAGDALQTQLQQYSETLGLENFYVHSLDLVTNPSALSSQINSYGIVFSGYSTNSSYKINQLFYASYDENYQLEGIYKFHRNNVVEINPSAEMTQDGKIMVMYESQSNGQNKLATAYSSNNGRIWSDDYALNTQNPYLREIGTNIFITDNDAYAYARLFYRPRIALDGNGGILYQFVDRYLILQGADPDYTSNPYNLFTLNFYFATQLFVGGMNRTTWYNYDSITEVSSIALGDSDRDNRQEILIGHKSKVSLLELNSQKDGFTTHSQKWQSQEYDRTVGSVAIFDANGNGWPELIFSVQGGDVFAFEVSDTTQVPAGDVLISKNDTVLGVNRIPGLKSTENLVADTNADGKPDLIVTSEDDGDGILRWSIDEDDLIDSYSMSGQTTYAYTFDDSRGKSIVVISDHHLRVFNSTMGLLNEITVDFTFKYHNNLLFDTTGDGLDELLILGPTQMLIVNPVTGSLIQILDIGGTVDSHFFDLIYHRFNGKDYLGFRDSDFSTYHTFKLFDLSGNILAEYDLPIQGGYDTTKVTLGDFDDDAKVELALSIIDTSGLSSLYVYNLDSKDLTEPENLMANITLPVRGTILRAPVIMYALDIDNFKGEELILAIADIDQSIISELSVPFSAVSAIMVVDIMTETVRWERTFANVLLNYEITNLNDIPIIMAYVENEGVYGLSLSGKDLFWVRSTDHPVSASIYDDTWIAVTDYNGQTMISEFTGIVSHVKGIITPQDYVVASRTTQFYDGSVSMTLNTVDVTGNNADDVFVGFNNGTMALRNYELGEYWRLDIDDFSSIYSTGLEYSKNRYGLAVTVLDRLLVFDRITSNLVLNASSDIGGNIISLIAFESNGYDVLLIQTDTKKLSIFDASKGRFTWNSTQTLLYSQLETGRFDKDNPNRITHIIGLGQDGETYLIPMPDTLLSGGKFPSATTGYWVDLVVKKQELTSVYMLSDDGELLKMIWHANGSISTYSLTEISDSCLSLDVYGDSVMITTTEVGIIRVEDTGSSFTIDHIIALNYAGHLDNQLLDTDNDEIYEELVIMGNQLAIFDSNGDIVETHSFSSPIDQLLIWTPDVSNAVAFLAILADGNAEISDPNARVLGQFIAPLQGSIELEEPREEMTIITPIATWTEYIVDNVEKADFRWVLLPLVFVCVNILLKRKMIIK
ncbi:MAG: VCBS repeat-containing protein [Candidatus Heimdallarchaeota archaeon]|nr:VCBS repeat-containing protein [Candidatus Heimdallarchaeota archaeon]